MLTGRVPFNGDSTVTIAIKHIQDPMPSIREIVPEIPISVENIVMKCTQKSPDRRYQNMGDVIRDLKLSLVNPDANIAVVDEDDNVGKTKISAGVGNNENYNENQDSYNDNNYDENYDDNYGQIEEEPVLQTPPILNTVWEDRLPKRDSYVEENDVRPAKKREKTNQKTNQKANQNTKKNKKKKKDKYSSNYDYNDSYDYSQDEMNRQKVRRKEYEYDYDDAFDDDEYDYNPKAEGLTTFLTIIAAVIIGLIVLYFVAQATGVFEQISNSVNGDSSVASEAQRAIMPEFENVDVDEVKEALNGEGLGCKTKYVESTQYSKNRVISAALEDGTTVLANDKILLNTTIVLTVSAGANGVAVPSVVGMTEAEGTASLTTEGYNVTKTTEYSTEYGKGMIISQSPEGGSIAPLETEVAIVISMGSDGEEVKVPELTGKTKDAAVSTLEAAGLTVGQIEESYSSDYPEGQICYQSYAFGTTVNEGTVIDMKISIGVETVTYNCNVMVEAPSDYAGGNAEVILTTADGSSQLWYSQNVTSFPVAINLTGFASPSAYGIVTISYFKNTESIVTDADGNTTTQVTPALAQTQQNVQFTKN
jgi:serine/threonine-protein kinase